MYGCVAEHDPHRLADRPALSGASLASVASHRPARVSPGPGRRWAGLWARPRPTCTAALRSTRPTRVQYEMRAREPVKRRTQRGRSAPRGGGFPAGPRAGTPVPGPENTPVAAPCPPGAAWGPGTCPASASSPPKCLKHSFAREHRPHGSLGALGPGPPDAGPAHAPCRGRGAGGRPWDAAARARDAPGAPLQATRQSLLVATWFEICGGVGPIYVGRPGPCRAQNPPAAGRRAAPRSIWPGHVAPPSPPGRHPGHRPHRTSHTFTALSL